MKKATKCKNKGFILYKFVTENQINRIKSIEFVYKI